MITYIYNLVAIHGSEVLLFYGVTHIRFLGLFRQCESPKILVFLRA
ncbi:hypothetical protein btf_174 [Dehalococcoides mccartyi BTF08]|nr:hypothetical protein btf_174 [Dehalococcoides mccartyi BTF08]